MTYLLHSKENSLEFNSTIPDIYLCPTLFCLCEGELEASLLPFSRTFELHFRSLGDSLVFFFSFNSIQPLPSNYIRCNPAPTVHWSLYTMSHSPLSIGQSAKIFTVQDGMLGPFQYMIDWSLA